MTSKKPLSDGEIAENAIMNMSVSERKYIKKDRDVEIAVKSIIIDALQEARKQAETDGSKEQAYMIIEDIKNITGCESMDALEIVESVENLKKRLKEAEKGNAKTEFIMHKAITIKDLYQRIAFSFRENDRHELVIIDKENFLKVKNTLINGQDLENLIRERIKELEDDYWEESKKCGGKEKIVDAKIEELKKLIDVDE